MPVAVTLAQLADFLEAVDAASTFTVYGFAIPDATVTARAITPATLYYNGLLGGDIITSNQATADSVALHLAARLLLQHTRQKVLAGGRSDSYRIGNVSVDKPKLLELVKMSIDDLEAQETRLYSLLVGAGTAPVLSDVVIQNPIADSTGTSRIDLDQPGYGSFVP